MNAIPFTCANCGLVDPKIDFMYFLTSDEMFTNPVSVPYSIAFRAILELLMPVNAVLTALFFVVKSVCLVVRVAIFSSVSLGAYVASDCSTAIKPAKCCICWS